MIINVPLLTTGEWQLVQVCSPGAPVCPPGGPAEKAPAVSTNRLLEVNPTTPITKTTKIHRTFTLFMLNFINQKTENKVYLTFERFYDSY